GGELIVFAPDIGPGAGDFVLTRCGVELRASFDGRGADIVGIGETAERYGLRECRNDKQGNKQQLTHVQIVYEWRRGVASLYCRSLYCKSVRQMSRLPNFFIVGAPKAGSTS